MIHVMLSNYDSGPINKLIIAWVRLNLQIKGYKYKLHFCRPFIYDTDIYKPEKRDENGLLLVKEEKVSNSDYVLWNPLVAGRNLDFVRQFQNSIVLLEKQTLLSEKINKTNPINENLAVNYGFYLMYLDEQFQAPKEWKLAIQADNYLITQKNFFLMVANTCKKENERKEFFDDSRSINKEQIIL